MNIKTDQQTDEIDFGLLDDNPEQWKWADMLLADFSGKEVDPVARCSPKIPKAEGTSNKMLHEGLDSHGPLKPYSTLQGNHRGKHSRRMNIAMTDDAYDFIRHEARKSGLTQGEYIYALARAAAMMQIDIIALLKHGSDS